MTRCPTCKSKKVYRGYRMAPLPYRVLGIREFLCEGCNLQFRGFSLLAPKSRKRKRHAVTLLEDLPATSQTRGKVVSSPAATEVEAEKPAELDEPVSAGTFVASSPGVSGQIKIAKAMSAPKEGKESIEISERKWEIPAASLETLTAKKRTHRSHQVCPHCGSGDTERRRRRIWEKAIFVFTDIRAYSCRICGGDFYARRRKKPEAEAE